MSIDNPLLWTPSPLRIEHSRMHHYMRWLEHERGLVFTDYDALWQWSVDHLEDFWGSIWQYFDIRSSAPYECVLDEHKMPGAKWFEGARLNLTEQLFRIHDTDEDADRPAIISQSELRPMVQLSWREMRRQITAVANSLRALGVQPGDRVAAYMPNIPETAIAFYACASIGAIWSSCSPDMGSSSVMDRFRQIDPKVLFVVDGYRYGGKDFDRMAIVEEMRASLPTVQQTVLLPYLNQEATLNGATTWHSLLHHPAAHATPIKFEQLPFDHPLWILYSSGTTGMPKPIVHGQGGIILEGMKGFALQLDLGPEDRFHWFSTTGWIMWNSQITAMMVGATACIYDGNPGYPDSGTMWQFAQRAAVTFFGAGAAYYSGCMKAGIEPAKIADLHRIRSIGSTGSPLSAEGYSWIYEHVGKDVMLAAMSGGTDIAANFVGSCPILPIHSGEMQCKALGVAVYAFDDNGKVLDDQMGELVVTKPMPTMPLYFWNDEGGKRYHESYFDTYPGVWRHGDWIQFTEHGGAVIYGRSDTTINRYGIRMGTSEIYRVVEEFPEVMDSLVVDLEYLGRESYMPLFVVLRPGIELDETLVKRIKDKIRTALSARHVPNDIFATTGIPRTLSGKKMELPIKKLLLGLPIEKIASRDAMSNPETLAYYVEFARLREVDASSSPAT